MKNPLDFLFSKLKLKSEDGKRPTKMGYVVLVALLGLLLLIVSDVFGGKETPSNDFVTSEDQPSPSSTAGQNQETFLQKNKGSSSGDSLSELEETYEEDLKTLLETVDGVSQVEVFVNLDATEKHVYERNVSESQQETKETDTNGGERTITDSSEDKQLVLSRQGDQETPILIQTKKPEVRGVLVVAKGADHMQVKEWIVEAVSRSLDVPTHRISVMPKKQGGN
ncbi:stage III sporulation protein AG [Pontibacillus halophilus JSM 076056 = DSM 19796]|uniref:Stage III sporulation protein AG n=1 Tax=Pontibacillus halophilus JSM 076056 = DSM 19796 TaxID=1385510 RepID=A0A0A5GIE5_9BACI|nr:stage III sporulation protein AG [Pontibacillus halophilus]KGX90905.1 stage III sporulation protein AG [Pontibacillus halophilus JSM 076056 = DSM 19796]